MHMHEAIRKIRIEIGDPSRSFETQTIGDGLTSDYDLPKQNIDPDSFQVYVQNGATLTSLYSGVDFQVNTHQGFLELTNPVPSGAILITKGRAWGLFTNEELEHYVKDAARQHCQGRTRKERMRTSQGFISYREEQMNYHNLPEIEEPLLVMLATINVLWTLANDAATDTDISTAEGTTVDRLGRYAQLIGHIQMLTDRYQEYCGQLNVGLYRTTTPRLRRKSYTTGRYVPLFEDREYDDARWPVRELPQIDQENLDDSGIPSPLWNSMGV